ncbi:uncharacterized protein HGUI_03694 [Hanseniaspora guilliermondii]|uniref:RING-type domain-containing protein n=1 Tax=Hanseniaspora guilliermondii TaxID=56406 RepID=A0A1L0CR33_9ASCO|nr:uncharacterized protein HGUI_03694 [Hanseniaspora guilliermondii]
MTENTDNPSNTINNLQVIALNVSYSLLYDSVPRSGSLKVIINNVPSDLLKRTETTRKKRFSNPNDNIPLTEDEKIVKKVVDMATLNTVTNLQRKFSQVLDELRSVSKETFEKLKVLTYEDFCEHLRVILDKDGVKDYNIDEEVKKQECGICLESYTLNKSIELNSSRKRQLESSCDMEDANIKKKIKTNDMDSLTNSANEEAGSSYTHEPVILTNCPHVFGRSCLYSWGNKNNSCPLCRTKISTKNAEYTMEELNEVLQNDESLTSMNFTELLQQSNRSSQSLQTSPNSDDLNSNMSSFLQGPFQDFSERFSQILERSITDSVNEASANRPDSDQQERGTVYIVTGNQTTSSQNNTPGSNNRSLGFSGLIDAITGNRNSLNRQTTTVLDLISSLFRARTPTETGNSSESPSNTQPPTTGESTEENSLVDPRTRSSQADLDASAAIAEAFRLAMLYRRANRDQNTTNAEEQNNQPNDTSNETSNDNHTSE